ncbi:uncharacterized protein LOC130784270 isoform X1 [Actinidia eriantha]|uniref:uncharacterized protein LOC130784270 isoform X1 n=1 Tax=Actinidia eriantha TaxID=165200 RepID=UPI002585FD4F|nr:uncharacterized protein LOC130784270 isoform X1 [Actinidia eriantha]XP_057500072.1 uncharacterized protein LOC130784270 isoform X1 [Actinidia eriantha]XP_057500073.1 uncharacterized protein LOC130784270 isoform X1 [Actinidia eriantha]
MLLSFIKYLCDLCVSFLVSFLNIQIFNLIFCIIVSGFLERFKLSISETPTNTTIEEAMYYATNPQTHKPREILFDWGNFSLWLMEITTDTHKVPDIPESGKQFFLVVDGNYTGYIQSSRHSRIRESKVCLQLFLVGAYDQLGTLVWMRFMATRQPLWNKKYNVKPRVWRKEADPFWILTSFFIYIYRTKNIIKNNKNKIK